MRILLQTDKEWCEFLLKEKIIHCELESTISSLRADLLQEHCIDATNESSSSSNKVKLKFSLRRPCALGCICLNSLFVEDY